MPLEIEAKAYADDLREVEETLKEMGAHFVAEVHEIDTYYSHPVRDFEKTDEALRIRVSGEKSFLTYKGAKIDPLSKTREEIEVELGNADTAKVLLVRLGFDPVAEVEKTRKIYHVDTFHVCLDTVKDVGTFVEVETTGKDVKTLRNRIIALLKTLSVKDFERKSYLELLLERSRLD
jgi:adenylate cyclase class 2